ncbi:MAG: hypothetical protein KBT36_05590 [Kurthia sp.]|nr:hypothetical protein [Candidatus Kurthia equi]
MKKNKLVSALFHVGQYTLVRRMFGKFTVKAIHVDEPVTIIVNHSNFYDSLVLFELQKKGYLSKNTVAMINKKGAEQFPLFKGIGTVPVSSPMKLSEFKAILQVMKSNNLLVFPQGREFHLEQRPVKIEPGVISLLNKNPQHGLLFVSLYYSYGEGIRGEIASSMHYVSGRSRPIENLQRFIEGTMEQQLDELKEHVVTNQFEGYQRLW